MFCAYIRIFSFFLSLGKSRLLNQRVDRMAKTIVLLENRIADPLPTRKNIRYPANETHKSRQAIPYSLGRAVAQLGRASEPASNHNWQTKTL